MKQAGYVYVLHFDSPLAHAKHYIGCTADPLTRLTHHAHGHSARILRELRAQGIEFRLAALGATHLRGMRRIERQVKNWHNAKEFCTICQDGEARALPGTLPYPIENLGFPLGSAGLRAYTEPPPEVTVRLTSPLEPIGLAQVVASLMKMEKDALGFIPAGGDQGLTGSIIAGRVAVAEAAGLLVGYCAFTENEREKLVRIHQCVVRDGWRGCGIGRQLVAVIAEARPFHGIQCKVRDDLNANGFWQAVGFTLAGTDTHETSGSQLNRYTRRQLAEGDSHQGDE